MFIFSLVDLDNSENHKRFSMKRVLLLKLLQVKSSTIDKDVFPAPVHYHDVQDKLIVIRISFVMK